MEMLSQNGVAVLPDLFPELSSLGWCWPVSHNMASSEVTEVLNIVGDDMIEINNDSLDMPVECVQEVVTEPNFFGDHQIIYGDELIVSSEDVPQSEEIVGSDSDPYVGALYVPVPSSNSDLDSSSLRSFVSKPGKQKLKQRGETVKREFDLEGFSEGKIRQHGSWQQKQVSIKTLEGEFSVTMWASGADDGEFEMIFKVKYFCVW